MPYIAGEALPGAIVREVAAGGAITKGTFVEITPGATPSAATYDGAAPGGVVGVALDNAAASGAPIRVCIEGEVSVSCDATGVDAYDYVSSGATGLAEVGVVATDYILGYAREAGAANGVCLVHLAPTFMSASPASPGT